MGSLSDPLLENLGPFLTDHAAFARGTNVQLAWVVGPREVEILIWERGVGRTSASGTSACAAAAASVRRGLVEPGAITVRMEGGSLEVDVSSTWDLRLRGPVREVGTGELGEGFLRWLGA
jgi:diaminopimelate epimerase